MHATAMTWFYSAPVKRPFVLAERVRNSLWEMRLGSLWLDTVSVEAPITLAGTYNGGPVRLEWEPGRWLRLIAQPEAPALVDALRVVVRRKPTLRYTDTEGRTVHEWWVQPAEAEDRWQEIQGKPAFGSPVRLDQAG